MHHRLRLYAAAAATAVAAAVVFTGTPAHADGATVVAMPTAYATAAGFPTISCDPGGWASWSGSGYTELVIGGRSTCSSPIIMSGQAHLYRNGGAAPWLSSPSFDLFAANAETGPGYSGYEPVGQTFFLQYQTTLEVGWPYTWTRTPPYCTGAGTHRISCSMIGPFVAG